MWPCVAIWIFDRCIRFFRLVLLNHVSFSKAIAAYNPQADIISLDVWPSNLTPYPLKGSYYFLYVLNNIRGYENHPFTLSTWEFGDNPNQNFVRENSVAKVASTKGELDIGFVTPVTATFMETSKNSATINYKQHSHPRLSFLIRPRDGFTARLRQSILNSPTSRENGRFSKDLKVLIEGPYGGSTLRFETFERILIVTGGSGISLGFSYLQEMCHKQMSSTLRRSPRDPSIYFIWAMPKISSIMDTVITAKLHHFASSIDRFSMEVFLTKERELTGIEHAKATTDSAFPTTAGFEFPIKFHNGRPDFRSIILEYAQATTTGKIAVVSCGPPQMADDCRRAVVYAFQEGCTNIELVEESFGW